jgi:hypothetical protein
MIEMHSGEHRGCYENRVDRIAGRMRFRVQVKDRGYG